MATETGTLCLKGKHVAFTGKLATMTRAEAAELVAARGGRCVGRISRDTHFLIIGQEGLPLTRKGGLTAKLARARKLQATGRITILSEEDFFHRLGVAEQTEDVHRLYSMVQLCRAIGVGRDRLRSWVKAGLLGPVKSIQGVAFFDFRQATVTRTLMSLAKAGVTTSRIRRSLDRLASCVGDIDYPLANLALLERDGSILVRLDDGQLAEPTGQIRFDFTADSPSPTVRAEPRRLTADEWWEAGLAAEEAGNLAEAVTAYRHALQAGGPDPQLCFNLGNVLARSGEHAAAAERFSQAVELEPSYAEAWNNLGTVLTELQRSEEALAAYRAAVAADPNYSDARYSLADLLEERGEVLEARSHWQAFLRLEPSGQWANYARRRLALA